MSNFITTEFLNLRRQPKKEAGNVLGVMPPDTVVEKINEEEIQDWIQLKTVIGKTPVKGYASQKFLQPTNLNLAIIDPVATIPAVHYPLGTKKITRNGTGRIYPLNEPGLIKVDLKQINDTAECCAQIHNVINFLDVEHSLRYMPDSINTYCNIYAYDVAYCVGAYLPRVWWTSEAIQKIKNGENIQPLYDQTVTEYTANRITDWFEKYGVTFGWKRLFDVAALQQEVNQGRLGIIVAQRINMNNSGHIDAVVPETGSLLASRKDGVVTSPLQSQAGSKNKKYYSGGFNWWEDSTRFKKFGFWLW